MSGPNYTFSSNVPQGPQQISSTQSPIQGNFQAINELLAVNHVSFADTTNYGQHTYTSLILLTEDPSTTSTEMMLYGKQTPDGSNAGELFYRYPSNGSVVQLTGTTGSAGGAAANGYSYISDTMMMKWGLATGIVANTSNVVVFPTLDNVAFTSAPVVVYIGPAISYTLGSSATYVTDLTTTQFTLVTGTYFASQYYWMAIGAF